MIFGHDVWMLFARTCSDSDGIGSSQAWDIQAEYGHIGTVWTYSYIHMHMHIVTLLVIRH
jgi:hypothetical protein